MTDTPPTCEFCNSTAPLQERRVSVHRQRQGQHFIFEDVPAMVCKACGQRYFSWEVAQALEAMMDAPASQEQMRPVPVLAWGR